MTEPNKVTVPGPGRRKTLAVHFVQLLGLASFALTQPLLALLGKYPEFLIAHDVSGLDIFILLAGLVLAVPVGLLLVEALAALLGMKALKAIHGLFLLALASVIALTVLNRYPSIPWAAGTALAAVAGLLFVLLYFKMSWCRSFASMMGFAALVFPIYLMGFTPVRQLLLPERSVADKVQFKHTPPIVMIIFDEFQLVSMLDRDREIDSVRFPHFAALAHEGNWYRRATAVHFYTDYAAPGILSGKIPTHKSLPILRDYPNNLFTLLGSQYKMDVFESDTQLCPPTLKGGGAAKGPSLGRRLVSTLADLKVLYAYQVLPRVLRGDLPSLQNGWMGFSGYVPVSGDAQGWSTANRMQTFNRFLEQITPADGKVLYYLHVKFPHSPYDYQPDGKYYAPLREVDGRTTLPNGDTVWTEDQTILDIAQQRYILQAGFTDTLLGRLVEKLKAADLYDKTLLIVTTDHGVSFRPGHHARFPDEKEEIYPDLLSIPLLIKLPRQTEGGVDDRTVCSADIMPTITDVLGCGVPWPMDGHSLLDKQGFPVRDTVKIYHQWINKGLSFKWDDIVSEPTLDHQVATYGDRQPLDRLYTHSPFDQLLGKNIDGLELPSSGIVLEHDQKRMMSDIKLASGTLPLYVSGRAVKFRPEDLPLTVAIALNGTIQSVTRTVPDLKGPAEFRNVLPRAAILDGLNSIEFCQVTTTTTGALNLQRLSTSWPYQIVHAKSGEKRIIASDGKEIPIVPGRLRGVLHNAETIGNTVNFTGWAINEKTGRPVDKVIVFTAGGKYIETFTPWVNREDIANWLGGGYSRCGFYDFIPTALLRNTNARFYALSGNVASEMQYLDPHTQALTTWNSPIFFDNFKLNPDRDRLIVLDHDGTPLVRAVAGKGTIESVKHSGQGLAVKGWAFDAASGFPPKGILVFSDGKLLAAEHVNTNRTDVAQKLNNPLADECGFDFQIPDAKLPGGVAAETALRFVGIAPGNQVWELTTNSETSFEQRRIQDFTVRRDGGLTIEIDPGIAWLTGYRKNAEFFPGHLTGRVIRPGATGPMRVAVAMNGTILDLVQMSDARPGDWSYDVPPNALGPDANRIGLYVVDQTSGGLVLSEGKLVSRPRMVRDPGGQTWLMDGNGGRLPVEDGALRGAVQPLGTDRDYLIVSGWAIDETRKTPVTKVAIFSGEDFVADLDVKVERKDLTGWLGESYLKCGFYRYLPLYLFKNRQVRAFAISGDTASELKYLYANPNGKTQLDAIPFFRFDRLRLDRDRIVNDAGKPFGIPGDEIKGRLLSSNVAGNGVEVAGWACDDKTRAPADAILVFLNGSYVGYGPVNQPTPDKAETPADVSRPLGFRLKLPSSGLGNVAVFAYMADGRLARLR